MAEQAAGVWGAWLAERARVRHRRGLERAARGLPEGALDLASNDYLGLSRHPAVVSAAAEAARLHGAGAGASRVVTGTHPVHEQLEARLCAYTGRRSALVLSSGYAANLGLLGALAAPGTHLVMDAHCHASLVDGARLGRAEVTVVDHGSVQAVAAALQSRVAPRTAVVVESVYSVLGDAAPLAELATLCADRGALLVVDEAHTLAATPGGCAVAAAGLADAGHVVVTATLSKALGSQGGAVLLGGAGADALREHLVNTSRTFLFDTGLGPPAAGAALAALGLADEDRIARLVARSAQVHDTLASHPSTSARVERGRGAVHSVRMDSPERAAEAAGRLGEAGVAVGCFRPPSVPDGVSRLRVTAHADHDADVLDHALHQIATTVAEVHA